MNALDAEKIVGRVRDLPTLPRTVLRITELINNPATSARDLAGVITDDQVLTVRLLRLVNSSFYGFPQRISTVTGAVVLLGFDAIRHLLLTTSIFELFSAGKTPNRRDQEALWDHSLACAVGAKVIGDRIGYDRIEELFVAGLLHDIGKIVALVYANRWFDRVAARVKEEDCLMVEAEQETTGTTHAEIGSLLARRWNLPSKLVAVIAHHHDPCGAEPFGREAAVVHLADIFARALDYGSGWDRKIPRLDPGGWAVLGLGVEDLVPCMGAIADDFEDIRSSMLPQ